MNGNKSRMDSYLVQKIMTASQEQLIAYVYESGANSCAQKNANKARRAVQVLVQSLNYDMKEVTPTFYNVYRYLNHLINRRRYNEARQVFLDLKQTWSKAFHLN